MRGVPSLRSVTGDYTTPPHIAGGGAVRERGNAEPWMPEPRENAGVFQHDDLKVYPSYLLRSCTNTRLSNQLRRSEAKRIQPLIDIDSGMANKEKDR